MYRPFASCLRHKKIIMSNYSLIRLSHFTPYLDIPSPVKPLDCIYQASKGYTFKSSPLDKNVAIYTVYICKPTHENGRCKNQKVEWKRIYLCNTTTASDHRNYLVCEFGNMFTPQTFQTYTIKFEGRNRFGTSTESRHITPILMRSKCVKGRCNKD